MFTKDNVSPAATTVVCLFLYEMPFFQKLCVRSELAPNMFNSDPLLVYFRCWPLLPGHNAPRPEIDINIITAL